MGERTEKILKEVNEQYELEKATVQSMSPAEKRAILLIVVVAVAITGLVMWIF